MIMPVYAYYGPIGFITKQPGTKKKQASWILTSPATPFDMLRYAITGKFRYILNILTYYNGNGKMQCKKIPW